MPFKIGTTHGVCPDDPESLLRDLRKRTIPGLLSHQADLIRDYLKIPEKEPDVALQLPTGSGKTLVGLLIGEWRRRKYGERVVYLCPTNQLVHQVAAEARGKYGIDVHTFVGRRLDYDAKASADWMAGEAMAITNYSSLFNSNPFFSNPNLILLDDAHSAENYIPKCWSVLIERETPEHSGLFSALSGIIGPLLPPADRSKLVTPPKDSEDRAWVEKIPTPALQSRATEIAALLDEHTQGLDLRHSWGMIRDSLHACHLYISRRAILIRPLIPPTKRHVAFTGAKQRLYMSATLGSCGDLERITGRPSIRRVPIPSGWDKQGIGRRLFLFPKRSLDESDTATFVMDAVRLGGRALYLVPDDRAARQVSDAIQASIGCPVFDARQIERSKAPFVTTPQAVAVVANRYDGIDFIDDDCRLLFADGLPEGANLQERFFVLRVTAQLLLDDRILTRLVQGFGRCTRSANDYAAVIVLGENLNGYVLAAERRQFFHPEIQAELQFGLEQSKEATAADLLEYLKHFFGRDAEWDRADAEILTLRSGMIQKRLEAANELAVSVPSEISYQNALWDSDFNAALEHCRAVIGKLAHPDLRGYRALWLYLAGSAAWLAHQHGQLATDDVAKDYFRQAQAAAPVLRWLVGLHATVGVSPAPGVVEDEGLLKLIERIEDVLEGLGTIHDRKYDAEESAILTRLLQDDDGKLFEEGHQRLGRLLGFESGNSDAEAAPDPWWIVNDSLCFVFEDNAEAERDTVLSATKARQAASHPNWIRAELNFPPGGLIVPVLVTPCTTASSGAIPHLGHVRYWNLAGFRDWAKTALQTMREIRREFTGPGNLAWRQSTTSRLKSAKIAPVELQAMLGRSAAEAMTSITSQEDS